MSKVWRFLWIVFGCWLILSVPARAQDHTLLFSTSGDATTAGGTYPDIDDEEIVALTWHGLADPAEFVSDFAWEAILGDIDGDGAFDDEPGELDALHIAVPAGVRPTLFDAFVSFSATELVLGGTELRDGDVARLLPGGGADIFLDEATFETWTGTADVDVDAFTIDSAGDTFFSFADNEETAYESLIQQNGGDPVLPDGTIFVVRAGETSATILHTEAAVLELVRAALGVSNSSIGDLQGLAPDPVNPGELFFAISSTSSQLEGTIFSTRNGGVVARLNGTELRGSGFGFDTEEALDALSIVPFTKDPVQIQMGTPDVPAGDAANVELIIRNGTPGGLARVLLSPAVLPLLAPTPDASLQGVGMFYVDTTSSLFRNSSIRRKFEVTLDSNGAASFRHPARPLPAGIQRIAQVIDLSTREISEAVIIEVISP